MKNKNMLILVLTCLAILGMTSVSAAGNYIIRNSSTTTNQSDLVIVDTFGSLNVTHGQIAENGHWLNTLYCALTGCTMAGTLNVGDLIVTSSIAVPDNSLGETDIDFNSTICGAGSHLYIAGGNLACEGSTSVNTTTQFDGDVNGTYNALNVEDNSHFHMWTNITDRPATVNTTTQFGGSGGQVSGTYDNLVLALHQQNCANITGNATNLCTITQTTDTDSVWNITGSKYLYNNTNMSLDVNEAILNTSIYAFVFGEELLNATINALAADITDVWVNTTGDTMTGALNMSATNVELWSGSNITGSVGTASTTMTIDASGNFIIRLV